MSTQSYILNRTPFKKGSTLGYSFKTRRVYVTLYPYPIRKDKISLFILSFLFVQGSFKFWFVPFIVI